jgi:hypothetical protein
MIRGFEIEFPPDTSSATAEGVAGEVAGLGEDVAGAGTRVSKGPVTDTILAWVQIAEPATAAVSAVAALVGKVVNLIRRKGLTGVAITLPGGAKVEADHASVEGIERLVQIAAASGD